MKPEFNQPVVILRGSVPLSCPSLFIGNRMFQRVRSKTLAGPWNTLNAMFQGPSKVFDLTRWNILLPVDNTNGLNTNNLALEINTGWLNSGFKYVDPADWTQKYFYLSTTNTMVFEAPWNGAR